jgi:hypothetical protein
VGPPDRKLRLEGEAVVPEPPVGGTAAAIRRTRSGSAIASISTILPAATVKPTTATGRPRMLMTTPAAPFTIAGRDNELPGTGVFARSPNGTAAVDWARRRDRARLAASGGARSATPSSSASSARSWTAPAAPSTPPPRPAPPPSPARRGRPAASPMLTSLWSLLGGVECRGEWRERGAEQVG